MRPIDADKVMEEINRIGGHNLCEWDTIGVKALICRQDTLDVVPRAEVDKEKSKGATEALIILYKELVDYHERIKNDYMELPQKSTNTARFRGASSTVEHICNMVLKLKKKYMEEQQSD